MMPVRIIARMDIKKERLIKGIHLEGWRFVGSPHKKSIKYYSEGIDELLYIDAVANLYNREILIDIIKNISQDIFIPITAGGGIRTLQDAYELLQAGADKVAINTGIIKNPQLITEIAKKFGNQCIVASIQAKKIDKEKWEAYMDAGREPTKKDVISWAKKVESLGAGEILLTSIDKDGTRTGFDLELVKNVSQKVSIPVIACGGCGGAQDFIDVVKDGQANAVAIAGAFHYGLFEISEIRKLAKKNNIPVREL